jgi:hypothetical protein
LPTGRRPFWAVYIYVTHTATVAGKAHRRVCCVGCSKDYAFELYREAAGGGHSPYGLSSNRASRAASKRAKATLARTLDEAVEPVSCPNCGIYQPDMVQVLQTRLGSKCDPNKWASMRAVIPWETAWHELRSFDTLEMYERFVDIWPSHSSLAEDRIRELRHPVLRKSASFVFWLLWGVVTLVAASFFVVLPMARHFLRVE